jgi:8-oxo-dGTP pyrophosphatase MutT (NUDIX family)
MSGTATSSGAIVLGVIEGVLRIAMAHEPNKGDHAYVLPKGHLEADETAEEAALREVAEEIGLDDVQLICYLGAIERESLEDSGETVQKTIHIWLAFCREPRPLTDGGEWLTPAQAVRSLPFDEDRAFLADRLAPMFHAGDSD